MKKLILPLVAFLLVSSLNSCAKCYYCKNAKEKIKFCTKDEDDKSEIDDMIESYEDSGYSCKSSSEAL